MNRSIIQKAFADIEAAWKDMQSVHIEMTVEEFEKKLLRMAKGHGIAYSQEEGKWLDMAKKAISDPHVPQEEKNLYLAEVAPSELKKAGRKFHNALMKLHAAVEWAYKDVNDFVKDTAKDERLRAFLRWRVLLVAEAYHKFYKMNLRGKITKGQYLKLRPVVGFRTS